LERSGSGRDPTVRQCSNGTLDSEQPGCCTQPRGEEAAARHVAWPQFNGDNGVGKAVGDGHTAFRTSEEGNNALGSNRSELDEIIRQHGTHIDTQP
jgi:hypothetical protein